MTTVEVKPRVFAATPAEGAWLKVLVCVGRASELRTLPLDLEGFEADHPVAIVDAGDLAALCVRVGRDYLVGPDAEARLSDLGWLAPRAVRHEELVRRAMAAGPVLPTRFGTAFSSAAAVRERVVRHAGAIAAFLDRVDGRDEMGLRLAVDRAAWRRQVLADLATSRPAPASPGARYIFERRLGEEASHVLEARLREACDTLAAPLRSLACDIVERRAVADRGDGLETAACHALLVPRDRIETLRAAAEVQSRIAEPAGLRLELTGPWPPYSFCPTLGETA